MVEGRILWEGGRRTTAEQRTLYSATLFVLFIGPNGNSDESRADWKVVFSLVWATSGKVVKSPDDTKRVWSLGHAKTKG